MASIPTVTRQPFTGSCHCGFIKYILFITLPSPTTPGSKVAPGTTSRIQKCNCSTCHKMGYFHVRPKDAPEDFILLSPLLDEQGYAEGLGDYKCFKEIAHLYFCGKCGVRCFSLSGEGEVVDVDLEAILGRESK